MADDFDRTAGMQVLELLFEAKFSADEIVHREEDIAKKVDCINESNVNSFLGELHVAGLVATENPRHK
ncbi:MAG: hypothetical protein ABEI52_00725 [Halobacteriaceae archaeon]